MITDLIIPRHSNFASAKCAELGLAVSTFIARGRIQSKKSFGLFLNAHIDATLYGSLVFQSPDFGERKSGIPLGVDIPAPVKAIACFDVESR